jgi:hypothetical protein
MGTSASGGGPRPTTPLIPGWIADNSDIPDENNPEENSGDDNPVEENPDDPNTREDTDAGDGESDVDTPDHVADQEATNRFAEARSRFTAFSRGHAGGNRSALRDSLRSYVRKASGGSSTLAKRMRPSAARVSRFSAVINTFKQGVTEALRQFNLSSYADKPLLDVLSALTDVIFDDESSFNDIQDDSITKLAYANTIVRIAEFEEIDLNSLTNENIEVMIAIFLEETIATRVICDVGTSLFKAVQNCQEILEIEETTYQIVSGLVRTQIMPQIVASQRGNIPDMEKSIENIYRIAFDCIAGTTEE